MRGCGEENRMSLRNVLRGDSRLGIKPEEHAKAVQTADVVYCKDCEHFHIDYEPLPDHYDTGRASCDKYNFITDFYDRRKINKLECVEEGDEE